MRSWAQRLLGWLFGAVYVRGRRYACYHQGRYLSRHSTPQERRSGFDWTLYQVMLSDPARLAAYRRDVEQTVAGRTVLEVGPGPAAVLTRMALRAGAARVVAVEGNGWAAKQAATRLRRVRADRDRIRVVTSPTEQLEVDDVGAAHVDVLLLECYHSIASQEQVVETVASLRQRGFSFDAVISRGFTTIVAPAAAPLIGSMTALERVALGWPARARPAAQALADHPSTVHGGGDLLEIVALAPPQRWQWCDFEADGRLESSGELTWDLADPERCAGLVFANQFLFHAGEVLDTGRTATHWGVFFWPLPFGPLPSSPLPSSPLPSSPGRLVLRTSVPDPAEPSAVTLQAWLGDRVTPELRL